MLNFTVKLELTKDMLQDNLPIIETQNTVKVVKGESHQTPIT